MSDRPIEKQERGSNGNAKDKNPSKGFFGLFGKYEEYGGILEGS